MNDGLIEELQKKDSDLRVIEDNQMDGYVQVETSIDFGGADPLDTASDPFYVDENLIKNELTGQQKDVFVRILRVMFMANALLSFFIATGFIPYQFLVVDEARIVSIVVFVITAIISTVLYVALTLLVNHRHALALFVLWVFPCYTAIISFAAIIRDIAPLQLFTITALQSCSVILYTVVSPRIVEAWKSFYIMLIVGLMGWCVGLLAFISQQDWVSAGLLAIAMLGTAAYGAMEIHFVGRYCLDEKDLIKAVIQFYTDPLRFVIDKLRN